MTLYRVATHREQADLFKAGPFMDTTVREVGARIRHGGY